MTPIPVLTGVMSSDSPQLIESSEPPRLIDDRAGVLDESAVLQQPADAEARWLLQARKARDRALRLYRARQSKRPVTSEGIGLRTGSTEVDRDAELIAQYVAESDKLFEVTVALTRRRGGG